MIFRCIRRFKQVSQRSSLCAVLGISLLMVLPLLSHAEAELPTRKEASTVNDRTISIIFHYEDTYRRLVADLGAELDESSDIRLVPVIGVNHVQSIYDSLYMKGIDLAIVHADVFEYLIRTKRYDRVRKRIHGVAKLFDEKIAIIANEKYTSLEDLAGQQVNFGKAGKGSDITGTILFDTLGIEVDIQRLDKRDALEKVKDGDIAATVYLIEGPVEEFESLSKDDDVKLLEIPQQEELLSLYQEAKLTKTEFPNLIDANDSVATLAVDVIISSYNWTDTESKRYAKLNRFVDSFVSSVENLKKSGKEPMWQQMTLGQEIPGVTRLAMVDAAVETVEAEKERIAAAERQKKAAELKQKTEELKTKLASRVDEKITQLDDPEELERLLDELTEILQESK